MTGPTKAEQIHVALRTAIIEQALEPGAKLPEDVIGETFGVGRTVARRALELLAYDELAEFRPNRGASVAKPTLEEGRDLFAVRIDLERAVARRLTGRLDESRIALLGRMVDKEHRALHDGRPEYIRLAAEFHIALGEMTNSPILSRFITQLVWRSSLVMRLYGKPRWGACNLQEHIELIEALTGSDADRSERLMASHLDSVLTRALDGDKAEGESEMRSVLARYA